MVVQLVFAMLNIEISVPKFTFVSGAIPFCITRNIYKKHTYSFDYLNKKYTIRFSYLPCSIPIDHQSPEA